MKSRKNKKGNPDKVHPYLARKALEMAGGNRNAAYSYCVELSWRLWGRLAPGFDNKDLQAFYDKEEIQNESDEEEMRKLDRKIEKVFKRSKK